MPITETVTAPIENTNPVQVIEVTPTSTDFPPTETSGQELAGTEPEAKPAPEPKPEEKKPETDPKFAAKFAALSRKEREIQTKERQLKESLNKLQQYENALKSVKQNPLELVKAAGYKDLEEYLQVVLNHGEQPDPYKQKVETIEQKIAAYEQQIAEQNRQAQEYQKQQQLAAIHEDIGNFVKANEEKYELISAYNAITDVWDLIERVFIESNGRQHMTMEEAADKVEEYYFERAKEEKERLVKVKKLQEKQEALNKIENKPVQIQHKVDVETSTEVVKPKVESEWAVAPTLTNQSSNLPQPNSSQRLTEDERMRRAIAKLRWTDD